MRSILGWIAEGSRWRHLITVARIGEHLPEEPSPFQGSRTVHLPERLLLTQTEHDITTIESPEALQDSLRYWRTHSGISEDATIYGNAYSHWSAGHNALHHRPLWNLTIAGAPRVYGWTDPGDAASPIVSVEAPWFAKDLQDVIVQWINARIAHYSSLELPAIHFLFPDYRGRINDVSVNGNTLTIASEWIGPERAYIGYDAVSIDNQYTASVVERSGETLSVRLPFIPFQLNVFLWTKDNELVDEFRTERVLSTWGTSLLRRAGAATVEGDLLSAINSGETQTIEFKEWIPPDQGKLDEFVETAVAFANTQGGSLVVGVNRRGEVVGVNSELMKWARGKNPAVAKQEYELHLRETLGTMVSCDIVARYRWLQISGATVLRIDFEALKAGMCWIRNGNRAMVRRAASNRAATPDEIAAALRNDSMSD